MSATPTTQWSTIPNAFASSADMYVSLSSASLTSFIPRPVWFAMMFASDALVRSALADLMTMSEVCPLMTWWG